MRFTSYINWLNETIKDGVIVLLPGSYKPMHQGHTDLTKRYANHPDVKEVKVLIGPGVRNGVTQKEAMEVANILLKDVDKVSIEAVSQPNPIMTAYEYIKTAEPGTYAMGGVKKEKDYERVEKFVKTHEPGGRYYNTKPEGVNVVELLIDTNPLLYKDRTDDKNGQPISASILRQDILNNDFYNFETNYPGYSEYVTREMWKIVKPYVKENINEKFTEDSDPIRDLGIGVFAPHDFKTQKEILDFIIKVLPAILHTKKIPKDIINTQDMAFLEDPYYNPLDNYVKKYIKLNGKPYETSWEFYNAWHETLMKMGYDTGGEGKYDSPHYKKEYENFLKESLNEAIVPQKNIHMTHAEDLVFLGGEEGLQWILKIFKQLYDKLNGHTEKDDIKLSIKFDGSPSVFCWSKFPSLEKPGVAIKGLFAKNPKVMFSNEDIDNYYKNQIDLANKLKLLLKYLPSLQIPENEIWQGDFLFDKDTLIEEDVFYSFHPNTIVYKVEKDSDLGKIISNADIGLVWHTKYTGNSLVDAIASYDVNISEIQENPKVFMTDPYIPSLAGYVTLTNEENNEIKQKLYAIDKLSKKLINDPNYKIFLKDEEIISLFKMFQNSLIKQSITLNNAKDYLEKFVMFIDDRYKKEADKKKTIKAKKDTIRKSNEIIDRIDHLADVAEQIIFLVLNISQLKKIFIDKLNNLGKFKTYLKTKEGKFQSTSQEGFAISDISGNIVKLVDRNEFSYANFSPDIIKGWVKK